jgi:ATP-binding cassette subfamily B protein
MLFYPVANGAFSVLVDMFIERMGGRMRSQIHQKAGRADPVAFESPSHLDDIEKARVGADAAIMIIFLLFVIVAFYGIYFAFLAVYLYQLSPILAIAIPLIFVPQLLTLIVRTRVFARFQDEAAPLRRRFEFGEKAIGDREFFKETRITGAFRYFVKHYTDVLALFNKEEWRAESRTRWVEIALNIVQLSGEFLIFFLLFRELMTGVISIGAFAAVFGSVGAMIGIMGQAVSQNLSAIASELGAARNFVRFMGLEERKGTKRPSGPAKIELKNASFRYPGADRDALRGVNLTVEPGETIAIVGENGAGKSTIVRLMTGLYLPTSGEVELRGVSTAEIAPDAIFHGTSAAMQAYQRYKMTLRDNVRVGDTTVDNSVAEPLEKADLDLTTGTFPQGEETMLSREFEGVDLSGGQWQRVALARAFYREHDLIALDEPTAATDPLEETRLYQKFAEISRGKTAIIVTHRLGSAKIADRIVVMDQGQIDAIGTHEELLRQGGKYAEMYDAQAQWYA